MILSHKGHLADSRKHFYTDNLSCMNQQENTGINSIYLRLNI